MKLSLPLLFLACFSFGSVQAQKCLTSIKTQQRIANDPDAARRVAELETFTQRWIKKTAYKTTAKHRIPVVVHVLYSNSAENVTDAQITSQFAVLNAAFSKTNANFSNTPAAFQSVAADAEMEFCLAVVDPNGAATTGITRHSVSSSFNGETDYFNTGKGGVAPWDINKYLNVYLVSLGSGSLGFTYNPGAAPAGEEGVVIDYKAWGTTGVASTNQPNHLGTTAVHEFGHYFNLEHIWGPNTSGCSDDDNVADTPPQDTESSGCPTFPTTDACTASGNGIMFMNYMDYSDDACMTMFTDGQKQRMKASIAGPWANLVNSTACDAASVSSVAKQVVTIAPNPARGFFTISFSKQEQADITLVNSVGTVVYKNSTNASQIRVYTNDLPAGWYMVKVSTEAGIAGVHKVFVTK